MKIFVVLDNYLSENSESGTAKPDAPVYWYEMADSTVMHTGNPFFVPDFDTDFRVRPSICLRLSRLGKGIAPKFAGRYTDSWTIALTVTAESTLARLRHDGLPWSRAVSFDRSCLLGNFMPIDTLLSCASFYIECGHESITYHADKICRGIDMILPQLSADNTIKTGDLIIIAPTPDGIRLSPGNRMLVHDMTDNMKLIDINIK